MSILVHTCCAPCGSYVFKRLREDRQRFKAFYYNPNIHPFDEYQRRRATLERYARDVGIQVTWEPYSAREYWQAIGQLRTKPDRCAQCYRLRLIRTAQRARAEDCEAFTTTLLISPYQDHERLKAVAEEVATDTGVRFHYDDYRVGYRESREMAREAGLYRQKYCGCVLSAAEGGRG